MQFYQVNFETNNGYTYSYRCYAENQYEATQNALRFVEENRSGVNVVTSVEELEEVQE